MVSLQGGMTIQDSKIMEKLTKHEQLRSEGLNLIASENYLSDKVRAALASDLGGRYHTSWYGGAGLAQEIITATEELAKKVFNAKYAFVNPLSGNLCDLAVLFSFTEPDDKVAILPITAGGYPLGVAKFERKFVSIPSKQDSFDIDVEAAKNVLAEEQPKLTILGASYIPFPHPVREISEFIQESGIPSICVFDGAHVLGLVACGQFQDPLNEGAEVLFGSTHKSLYGPQGGLILTNSSEHYEALLKYLEIDLETGIGLVDNPHVNRIAALGMALEELRDDSGYGKRVIENAQALAKALDELGVPVRFQEHGYTSSHQVFMAIEPERAQRFCHELEQVGIFIDEEARLGTAEVTHRGMGPSDMQAIAELLAEAYLNGVSDDLHVRVKRLIKL